MPPARSICSLRIITSSQRRPGFTLMEALITMLLVSLVFGVAADLLSNASRVMSFGSTRNTSSQAVQVALVRVTSEVREAFSIVATGSTLEFLKVDPGASRFPLSPPTPWDPHQPQLLVRYYVNQGQLWRDVGPNGGPPVVSQMVADGIYGLACDLLPNKNLEISLGLMSDQAAVRSLTTQVRPPAVP